MKDPMDGRFSKIFAGAIIVAAVLLVVVATRKSYEPGRLEQMASEGVRITDSDFEVKEYIWRQGAAPKKYLLEVTNHSDQTIDFDCNTTAFDSQGKNIGISYNRVNCIPSGDTGCMAFDFNARDPQSFKYELYYELSEKNSAADRLVTKEKLQGKKLEVSVKNEGEQPAKYVRADVLFFREGELVDYATDFLHEEDSENINAGKSVKKSFSCAGEFDDVKVYYSAQKP